MLEKCILHFPIYRSNDGDPVNPESVTINREKCDS